MILNASRIQHEHEQNAEERLRAAGSYHDVLTWRASPSSRSSTKRLARFPRTA